MNNKTDGSNRGWVGTAALVIVMLGTHVLLAQTTDIEGWPRSTIAIAAGIVAVVLTAMIKGKRKGSNSTLRN